MAGIREDDENPDHNPFSFKNFLSKKTTGVSAIKKTVIASESLPDLDSISSGINDTPLELPGFVHQQQTLVKGIDEVISNQSSVAEGFTSTLHQPEESFSLSYDKHQSKSSEKSYLLNDLDEDEYIFDTTSSKDIPSVIKLQNAASTAQWDDEDEASHSEPELNKSEMQKLKAENESLTLQLATLQKQLKDKIKRVSDLELELKVQSKREAEDTKALEAMVQQVEENLTKTTQRAISAETAVSKMKHEIKSLQGQVKGLQKENESLQVLLLEQRDKNVDQKVEEISKKLHSAAGSAEVSLRSLLKGVDELKFLASLVADVTKVQEPPS